MRAEPTSSDTGRTGAVALTVSSMRTWAERGLDSAPWEPVMSKTKHREVGHSDEGSGIRKRLVAVQLRSAEARDNYMKHMTKMSVLNWALQRKPHPQYHLAVKFTRYAHYYPQIMWKTDSLSDESLR